MSTGQPNVRTGTYKAQLARLPPHIQRAAQQAFEAFVANPRHPALNDHPLGDTSRGRHRIGSRSVRVTRSYRAIYVIDGPTTVWYWIGSHEDYNNFIGSRRN